MLENLIPRSLREGFRCRVETERQSAVFVRTQAPFFSALGEHVPSSGVGLGRGFDQKRAMRSSFTPSPCLGRSHVALSAGANTVGKRPALQAVLLRPNIQGCRPSFL